MSKITQRYSSHHEEQREPEHLAVPSLSSRRSPGCERSRSDQLSPVPPIDPPEPLSLSHQYEPTSQHDMRPQSCQELHPLPSHLCPPVIDSGSPTLQTRSTEPSNFGKMFPLGRPVDPISPKVISVQPTPVSMPIYINKPDSPPPSLRPFPHLPKASTISSARQSKKTYIRMHFRRFIYLLYRIVVHYPRSLAYRIIGLLRSCISYIFCNNPPPPVHRGRRSPHLNQPSVTASAHRSRSQDHSQAPSPATTHFWTHETGHCSRSSDEDDDADHHPRRRKKREGYPKDDQQDQLTHERRRHQQKKSKWLRGFFFQVGAICCCLIADTFAQAVLTPFVYYMVRDFHVGGDQWIGYYAGLLLTGYWGANMCTTLLWGHLSDKYGRKVILLFSLLMTGLTSIMLGLSESYHDAMLALVLQGACTGLLPISKCAIGELAARYQKQQEHWSEWDTYYLHGTVESQDPPASVENGVAKKRDFAAIGYSAIIVAIALGAALGPLAGGNLTKVLVPGFESHIYFAPCLLSAIISALTLFIVTLVFQESHPRWANLREPARPQLPPPSSVIHDDRIKRAISLLDRTGHSTGYVATSQILSNGKEISRTSSNEVHHGIVASAPLEPSEIEEVQNTPQWQSIYLEDVHAASGSQGCSKEVSHEKSYRDNEVPRCSVMRLAPSPTAVRPQEDLEHCSVADSSKSFREGLSPSTRLCLVLSIYTFLVLTSIFVSEFLMLYTQTPILRGGLEFSAKKLGQLLTIRGIFKLLYTVVGYPRMIGHWGLLRCLRVGILTIGFASIVGFGIIVPWIVNEGLQHEAFAANTPWRSQSPLSEPRWSPDSNAMGAGAVLLAMCIIATGDALGYISVLVLFGQCVDHIDALKCNPSSGGSVRSSGQQNSASSSGNGVLWGVAQVTTNVMRLAGPVIAGLLWSLAVQTTLPLDEAFSTGGHTHFSASDGSTSGGNGPPDAMSIMRDHLLGMSTAPWTSTLLSIIHGPTNVFFLAGGISLLNYAQSLYVDWQAEHLPAQPLEQEHTFASGGQSASPASISVRKQVAEE